MSRTATYPCPAASRDIPPSATFTPPAAHEPIVVCLRIHNLSRSINPPQVFKQTHCMTDTKLTQSKALCLACTTPELTPSGTPQPCETSLLGGKATRGAHKGPHELEAACKELEDVARGREGESDEDEVERQPGRSRSETLPKYFDAAALPCAEG